MSLIFYVLVLDKMSVQLPETLIEQSDIQFRHCYCRICVFLVLCRYTAGCFHDRGAFGKRGRHEAAAVIKKARHKGSLTILPSHLFCCPLSFIMVQTRESVEPA